MTVRSSLLALATLAIVSSIAAAEPAARRPAAERPTLPIEEADADENPLPVSDDLSGEWRMFLPAGWEREVRIERLGENRYYVRPPYVMKGTYEIRGREMTFVSEDRLEGDADPDPEDESKSSKPDRGFVWTVRSPYLMTLTSSAAGYRDAVLFRSNGRELAEKKTP